MKVLVIANGWNCQPYVRECIESIHAQTHKDFHLVVVNDASTDGTLAEAMKVANELIESMSITVMSTKENIGTAYARMTGEQIAEKMNIQYDVVVWVDLDDQLLPNALERIVQEYQDPECWLTYGNMKPEPFTPDALALTLPPRENHWVYIHPRSHRRGLVQHLTDEDIAADKFSAYPDINMLYCMLELAGPAHIRTISEPLYIYRSSHPNVCIKRFSFEQRQKEKNMARIIPPKAQLKCL